MLWRYRTNLLASWPTTETGRLSLRTGDLARAVAEAPPVRHLLEVRRLENRVRDFGRALLDHVHPATQRIHGDFMPAAAKSGRFSCREPNLQQLPPEARVAFRAPPGRRLVVADYSQMVACPDRFIDGSYAPVGCAHLCQAYDLRRARESSAFESGGWHGKL